MLRTVVVAAIQMGAFWAASEDDFRVHLRHLLEDAKRQGAELVALPQYLGVSLVGMLEPCAAEASVGEAIQAAGYRSLTECYQAEGAALTGAYEQAGTELAREFGLHLAFGSTILVEQDGRLCDVAYLFGPDGAVLGTQRRTHLCRGEDGRQWSGGEELSVFRTSVGRLGFLVGTDAYYPEVGRILCLQGANVLIHLHQALHYSRADWMRRLWREVQANQVFGIESCMVGLGHRGRATIHAPLGMTLDGSGIVAGASSSVRPEVIAAKLDFVRLQEAVDAYPIYSALNYGMYRKQFPTVYASDGVVATDPS